MNRGTIALIVAAAVGGFAPPAGSATIDKFGAGHVVGFELAPDQAAVAALAQEAGVKWTREDFSWHLMEPSQGSYSFSNQNTFVNSAVAGGMTVLGSLQYTPDFYSESPGAGSLFYPTVSAQGLTAWSTFVTAVVNQFKDRVHAWQIWPNLEDTAFWKGGQGVSGMTKYKALLDRAYTAIKAADPTATVLVASIDPDNLNDLIDLGSGGKMDLVAIHNYTNDLPESSTMLQLRLAAVRDVAARRLSGKSIFNSQYGWHTSTALGGISETTHAAYLIRSMLLHGAYSDIVGSVYENHKDTDATGGGCEAAQAADNFGMLLRCAGNAKKQAFDAYKAMTTALAGATFVENIEHNTSTEIVETFEGATTYSTFTAPGGTVNFEFDSTIRFAESQSGKVVYTRTDAHPPMTVVPNPTFFKPVTGTPSRFCVWARGDGGPAVELTVAIRDATSNDFQGVLGLIEGVTFREYCFAFDAPLAGNALMSPKPPDNTIDFPIQWGGFAVTGWSVATPATSGTIWLDNATFKSGPTVYHQRYTNAGKSIHALWSIGAATTINVPTTCTDATARDWTNAISNLVAAGGNVTVNVNDHPIFVTETCTPTLHKDSVGVFRPSNGLIYLRNTNTSGIADVNIVFGIPNDKPIAGDWDNNGTDTIGVFRGDTFYLKNSNQTGFADLTFTFGTANDLPVAGDWNGDGIDTIGLYRDGLFILRNANSSGNADMVFSLGVAGDLPIAGDWDGDGTVTVGVFRPSNGALYLKNTNATGFADIVLTYGIPNDKPVTGDWDNNGTDTIGVFRGDTFFLRNSNTSGFADMTFSLGLASDVPIGGNWDGLP